MARRLKYDIPGPDWRVPVEAVRERGFEALFSSDVREPLPLVVEIGFGRGEFVLDLAATDPETAFVAIEYSAKRVLKMARRLARTELRNLRLVEAPAEELLRDGLAASSVKCFWINFPDPWPKKRHFKRRLIQPALVRELARCLVSDGVLNVATDHAGYAEWIDEALRGEPQLANCFAPDPFRAEVPGRKPTAYELEWRSLGRALHFFSYAKRERRC